MHKKPLAVESLAKASLAVESLAEASLVGESWVPERKSILHDLRTCLGYQYVLT